MINKTSFSQPFKIAGNSVSTHLFCTALNADGSALSCL